MFLLVDIMKKKDFKEKCFRLLYSEICSYLYVDNKNNFYVVLVFVSYIRRYVLTKTQAKGNYQQNNYVFVSYIRRYVLTRLDKNELFEKMDEFSSPIFGDMFLLQRSLIIEYDSCFRLLYSEICSYWLEIVVTGSYSHSRFSSPIFGDMFLLTKKALQVRLPIIVFVSYIRRYVLTKRIN